MKLATRIKAAVNILRGRRSQASMVIPVGSSLVNNMENLKDYLDNAYERNAIVYAIVTRIAQKFASVPIFVYEVSDQAAFKRYKAMTHIGTKQTPEVMAEANKLRKKAFAPLDRHPLIDLLNRPNGNQGEFAFKENLMLQRLVFGAATAWANRFNGKGEPLELIVLPTQYLQIIVDRDDQFVPAGYMVQNGVFRRLYNKEEILYWKYTNLDWSTWGSQLYGMSPLEAAAMEILERNAAGKSSATGLQNNGGKGLIYADTEVEDQIISKEETDQLQLRLDSEVNGIKNVGRVHIVNRKIGYINLSQSALDQGIAEVKRMTKEDICGVYQFPYTLLDTSSAKFENYQQAVKSLVINKIIPEWISLRDELNRWLRPMYPDGNKIWIEPDFSAIPEMQDDLQKMVESLDKMWYLTPNEKRAHVGWEVDDKDPNMDRKYIPANLMPLEQMNIVPPDIDGDVNKLTDQGLLDYKDGI